MASFWLSDYPTTHCPNCAADIVWLRDEAGENIPLDVSWVRRAGASEGLGLTLYQPSVEHEGVAIVRSGPHGHQGGYSCHDDTCPARKPEFVDRRGNLRRVPAISSR